MMKLNALWLCAVLALAACGGNKEETSNNSTTPSTQTTAPAESGNSDLDKEIDAGLTQMKGQLPMKMGDVMEITSVERSGKDINYTYTFLTDAVKKDNFKLEDGKKSGAQQLCANSDTKKYLDAGYNFNFNYVFKDGSELQVPFSKGDC